jgi:hypothetical protein
MSRKKADRDDPVERIIAGLSQQQRAGLTAAIEALRADGVEVGFHPQRAREAPGEVTPEGEATPEDEVELLLRTLEVYRATPLPFQVRQTRDALVMAEDLTREELSFLVELERVVTEHAGIKRRRAIELIRRLVPPVSGPGAKHAIRPRVVRLTHGALVDKRGMSSNEAVRAIADRIPDLDERKIREYLRISREAGD